MCRRAVFCLEAAYQRIQSMMSGRDHDSPGCATNCHGGYYILRLRTDEPRPRFLVFLRCKQPTTLHNLLQCWCSCLLNVE